LRIGLSENRFALFGPMPQLHIGLSGNRFALFGPMPYMMVMADGKNKTSASISAAAQRALAEAQARRKVAAATALPKEINGRDGPDPTRFGDWEVKGIASDF
jgi:hypothetical protein